MMFRVRVSGCFPLVHISVIGLSSGDHESQEIGMHDVKIDTQILSDTRRAFVQ